jgi:hypothetical protein
MFGRVVVEGEGDGDDDGEDNYREGDGNGELWFAVAEVAWPVDGGGLSRRREREASLSKRWAASVVEAGV